jgi:hypothetical protein
MPIALRPEKQTFDVSLAVDADLPVENRPTFVCRHKTVAQWLDLVERRRGIGEAKDNAEANRLLNAYLMEWLVNVRNFNNLPLVGILDDAMTVPEKWELVEAINVGAGLSTKKNSPSA